MHGAALTADTFAMEGDYWGLSDRFGQVTPATSTAPELTVFRERSSPGLRTFRLRPSAPLLRAELEEVVERQTPVLNRMAEIAELRAGWNSYNARPIEMSNVVTAVNLLLRYLPAHARLPMIVPTVHGGIQLEWHTPSVEVEVYVNGPSAVSFLAANLTTGEEFEGPVPGNEQRLAQWISLAR